MQNKLQGRLLSLDVFRGITIAAMLLVNNPGTWSEIYPPLRHAAWHGCTPTDWIFPFFLFIVGVAITLSLTRKKEAGTDINKLILTITKRGLIIFGLGLLMALIPKFDFTTVRIPGVLQRIGIVYIIASVIFLKTSLKTQMYITGGILIFYWIIMTLIPVPGVGYANLEPTTNFAAYIDNIILKGHMWSATKVWDPEGLVSTIPAVGTAMLGIFLGHWMRTNHEPVVKTVWMFVFGVGGLVIGEIWGIWFPINKSLWTSSYVVYCGGIATIFFAMCYWLADIQGYKWWTKPFVVYGVNAITVFVMSGIMAKFMGIIQVTGADGKDISLKGYIYNNLFLSWLAPINASLGFAITFVLFWLGILWIMYKRNIIIKV